MLTISKGLRDNIYYGGGMMFEKGAGLILMLFTTRYLTEAQFGILEVLVTFIILFTVLQATSGALEKYVAHVKCESEKITLLSSTMIVAIIIGSAFLIISLAFLDPIIRWSKMPIPYYSATLAISLNFLSIIRSPLTVWLRIEGKASAYTICAVVGTATQIGLTILLLVKGYGINGYFLGSLAGFIISIMLAGWFCRAHLGLSYQYDLFKKVVLYALPLMAAGIVIFGVSGLDKWLLAYIMGVKDLAVYAVATKFVVIIGFLFAIPQMWWTPKRILVLYQEDGHEVNARINTYLISILLILVVSIGLISDVAIKIAVPSNYHAAITLIPWLALAYTFNFLGSLNVGVYIQEKPIWPLIISIATAAIAVPLYLYIIPIFGVFGLVASLIFIHLFKLVLLYCVSQRLAYLPYKKAPIVMMFALAMTTLFTYSYSPDYWVKFFVCAIGLLLMLSLGIRYKTLPKPSDLIKNTTALPAAQ